jgi:hypothetical protein
MTPLSGELGCSEMGVWMPEASYFVPALNEFARPAGSFQIDNPAEAGLKSMS